MILFDTHAAIWLSLEPGRLSRTARKAIEESGPADLALSVLSVYEITWLIVRGRIAVRDPVETFVRNLTTRFDVRPVTPAIAAAAAQLPSAFPSDPFDRIIAATAIVERIPLVTADLRIRRSRALPTLW